MLTGKVKGALAWGGLALILAVPSADIISANMGSPAATPSVPEGAPEITTASIDGVKTVVPVLKTLPVPANGKPMPDYISDPEAEPETAVTTPVVAPKPTPVAQEPAVQTAVIPPQPMPAHMRPLPPMTTQPAVTTTPLAPAPQTDVATVQQPMTTTQPLILDEEEVLANEAAIDPPAAPASNVPRPPAMVGEDDLQDWDSGSLADYLERRGLLSEATYSEETVGDNEEYDEDGFFLSDGPNQPRRNRRNLDDEDSFLVFPFD